MVVAPPSAGNEGAKGSTQGYTRCNRFQLRRVGDVPPQSQSQPTVPPGRQQQQQYRASTKGRKTWVRDAGAQASAAPLRKQAGTTQQQGVVVSKAPPQPWPGLAAASLQRDSGTRPAGQKQQKQKPPGRPQPPQGPAASGRTIKVLDKASSQQARVLVYRKSKSGKSLQRTGVRAVTAKHGMTWHNPAMAAVSRPAAAAAAPVGAAAARPAAAPRQVPGGKLIAASAATAPRALPSAIGRPVGAPKAQVTGPAGSVATNTVRRRSGKWNKYVRPAAAQLSPPKRPGKWNKYVRVSPRPSTATKPTATAMTSRMLPGARPLATPAALHRAASGSKTPRLLRLGSSMYKVLSKGRSRSLHRQRSSPLPGQQQQQPVQPMQRHAAPHTALAKRSPAARPASRAPAALRPLGSLKKARHQQQQQRSAVVQRPRCSSRTAGSGGGSRIVFCPVYCRTGKCERRSKGCPYKHDTTKRAVCPRWLHGNCSDPKCPLQHQRKKELMPVCMHFLKGLCTASDCPYLHINVSAGAPVCKAFLRGHCAAGAECPHKHYTLRMVKEERRLQQQGGAAAEGGPGSKKRSSSGRCFDAQPAKRACSSGGGGAAAAAAPVPQGAAAGEAGGDQQQGGPAPRLPDFLLDDIIPL